MLHPSRDIDAVARLHRLSPLLVEAPAADADQDLTAAAFCMMDMPVIAASRLEGHIVNPNLLHGDRREIPSVDKGTHGFGSPEQHLTA